MALIKCTDCGNQVSDAAPTCIRCGRPIAINAALSSKSELPSMYAPQRRPTTQAKSSKELSGGFVVLVFIALGIWLYYEATSSSGSTVSQPVNSQQEQFERIRAGRLDTYNAAPNEIQKSAIFNEANSEDDRYFKANGPEIKDWAGRITSIRTSHGGTDVDVEITSSTNTVYRQYSIAQADSLYSLLTSIPEGSSVEFSGTFDQGIAGRFREMSFTEIGSIREPTFDVSISSIHVAGSQVSSGHTTNLPTTGQAQNGTSLARVRSAEPSVTSPFAAGVSAFAVPSMTDDSGKSVEGKIIYTSGEYRVGNQIRKFQLFSHALRGDCHACGVTISGRVLEQQSGQWVGVALSPSLESVGASGAFDGKPVLFPMGNRPAVALVETYAEQDESGELTTVFAVDGNRVIRVWGGHTQKDSTQTEYCQDHTNDQLCSRWKTTLKTQAATENGWPIILATTTGTVEASDPPPIPLGVHELQFDGATYTASALQPSPQVHVPVDGDDVLKMLNEGKQWNDLSPEERAAATGEVRRQLAQALEDPLKVELMECAGIRVYPDPQPSGHPPSRAKCLALFQSKGISPDMYKPFEQ